MIKINRQQLMDLCEKAIKNQKVAQTEWDVKVEEARKEYERVWRDESLPNWRVFYERLGKALRKGASEEMTHITSDMMPKGVDRYGNPELRLYRPFKDGRLNKREHTSSNQQASHELGPRPVYQVRNLENLLTFLETVTDETVTDSSLERVGFRNLARLMDAVNNGYWED